MWQILKFILIHEDNISMEKFLFVEKKGIFELSSLFLPLSFLGKISVKFSHLSRTKM